jgi:DNA-binding GntR family transcriptional regulator
METAMDGNNPTRTERLAEELADAILSGALSPGSRLDEHSLAQNYGVSRTPVREALRQLATSGLIEMRPRKGAIVSQVTVAQLEAMFGAMAEMEATCARLASMSMTPLERRRLQSHHDGMADLVAAGQPEPYAEANHAFHTAIYAGAHNAVLADFTTALRRRLAPFRRAQFRAPGRLARSHAEHDAVVKAILSGDAGAAHAAMLHHVSLVEDAFEQLTASNAA